MADPVPITQGQMLLELDPIVKPDGVTGLTIQERFEAFHTLNPTILTALEKLTTDYLAAGHTRVGVKMLFEVLRWHYGIATKGDEFRLNNNYTSRYVRKMIARNPHWSEVFATRELQSA